MAKELIISYKDYEGNVTERRISDIIVENSRQIDAYCHLRNARRSFVFKRIMSAIDAHTGEVIEDMGKLYGFPVCTEQQTAPIEQTSDVSLNKSYKDQRSKQKYEFAKPFYTRVIYDLYKKRLFDLFGKRCFKCGASSALVFDHHVPIALGGILAPGNIVVLCRRCNGKKHRSPPELFYTKDELQRLQPILDREESVLDFTLDWKAWCNDRKHYLLSLGVDPALVNEVLFNSDHPWYVGTHTNRASLEITVSLIEDDDDD